MQVSAAETSTDFSGFSEFPRISDDLIMFQIVSDSLMPPVVMSDCRNNSESYLSQAVSLNPNLTPWQVSLHAVSCVYEHTQDLDQSIMHITPGLQTVGSSTSG